MSPKIRTIACLALAPVATLLASSGAADSGWECGASCREYDVDNYQLSGYIDWERPALVASEEIWLDVRPPFYPIIELDAAVEVRNVTGETFEVGAPVDLPFLLDAEAHRLRVDLRPALRSGGDITLRVNYRAPSSWGLRFSQGGNADPVRSRVAYTLADPNLTKHWLVSKQDPSDRAGFSVNMQLDPGDDLVAPGSRGRDEECSGFRCVDYHFGYSGPTHAMGFAVGQLDHVDGLDASGRQVRVWHRRGLLVDSGALLAEALHGVQHYALRLGAWAWGRHEYSMVLLPELPANQANAAVGFLDEGLAADPRNVAYAHELVHQWYSNWVGIKSYDDLWVKEGLAGLLERELVADELDEAGTERSYGSLFPFDPADALRDGSLPLEARHTTGLSGRATWLLAQIERVLGKPKFRNALASFTRWKLLGVADSEEFVRSFAQQGLDEATIVKVLRSLDAKEAPRITSAVTPRAGGATWTLNLSDPAGTLIAPIELTTVDALGRAETHVLREGAPLDLTIPPGGYVAPDEPGVHPFVPFEDVRAWLVPRAPAALAAFAERSPSHQERAMLHSSTFPSEPAQLAGLYPKLDSSEARRLAELRGCAAMRALPPAANRAPWIEVMGPLLQQRLSAPTSPGYGDCGIDLATRFFLGELESLIGDSNPQVFPRFLYLVQFDYGARKTFQLLSNLATSAPSDLIREGVIQRLTYQITHEGSYERVPAEDRPEWAQFFLDRIKETTVERRLLALADALLALGHDDAATELGFALRRTEMAPRTQARLVCLGYKLAATRPAAWAEFQDAAVPWWTLSPEAQAALIDPTVCK